MSESYWQASAQLPSYPKCTSHLKIDVAVVGGGVAGLTIAYLLSKSGLSVAVFEKNTIGSATTNKTTGKVTSQHNLMYAELQKRFGMISARIYGQANQEALKQIGKLIEAEQIDCDWTVRDSYVYTTEPKQIQKFEEEVQIATRLGLPATFDTNIGLPFRVQAAVKFSDQASIHIQKYLAGLARCIQGYGGHIFEHSQITSFRDGKIPQLKTDLANITAKDIVVATKAPASPLVARGLCAGWEYPHTSYIVAGEYSGALRGMYISPDSGHYSLLPVKDGKTQLLLVGGNKHIPGLGNPKRRYKKLATYAKEYFGINQIQHQWKGMDYLAYDNVPLIGKLYPWSKHMYVVTGFKKWGITTSMVAAIILRDLLHGADNPWAATFNSQRLRSIASIPHALKEIVH